MGLALLLSPMVPGLGREIGGAHLDRHRLVPAAAGRVRQAVPRVLLRVVPVQPHRDQLAVGGKKVLGLQLPRLRDLGPIVIVWIASMGVLIVQHDLGTSLMFFAMFVAMLYVAAPGGRGWILIGGVAFAIGCIAAARIFTHVGYRVEAWLHPFDPVIYNRYPGGSRPDRAGPVRTRRRRPISAPAWAKGTRPSHRSPTPISSSPPRNEELGLVGIFAILLLYLLVIAAGMVVAMKIGTASASCSPPGS